MKQYVIDQLRLEDYKTLKAYLDKYVGFSQMGGIYWIPIEETLLSDVQKEHTSCQPYYFAVDLEENLLSCELLVRTKERIRCNCIAYANENQRNWFIQYIDTILEKLEISV